MTTMSSVLPVCCVSIGEERRVGEHPHAPGHLRASEKPLLAFFLPHGIILHNSREGRLAQLKGWERLEH